MVIVLMFFLIACLNETIQQHTDADELKKRLGQTIQLNRSDFLVSQAIQPGLSASWIRMDPDLLAHQKVKTILGINSKNVELLGNLGSYRLLLGGASHDFQRDIQTNYDTTSLLTFYKINQDICAALVGETEKDSQLPFPYLEIEKNLDFLIHHQVGLNSTEHNQLKKELKKEMIYPPQSTDYLEACLICAHQLDVILF
jgi:hypothetical protein